MTAPACTSASASLCSSNSARIAERLDMRNMAPTPASSSTTSDPVSPSRALPARQCAAYSAWFPATYPMSILHFQSRDTPLPEASSNTTADAATNPKLVKNPAS